MAKLESLPNAGSGVEQKELRLHLSVIAQGVHFSTNTHKSLREIRQSVLGWQPCGPHGQDQEPSGKPSTCSVRPHPPAHSGQSTESPTRGFLCIAGWATSAQTRPCPTLRPSIPVPVLVCSSSSPGPLCSRLIKLVKVIIWGGGEAMSQSYQVTTNTPRYSNAETTCFF